MGAIAQGEWESALPIGPGSSKVRTAQQTSLGTDYCQSDACYLHAEARRRAICAAYLAYESEQRTIVE